MALDRAVRIVCSQLVTPGDDRDRGAAGAPRLSLPRSRPADARRSPIRAPSPSSASSARRATSASNSSATACWRWSIAEMLLQAFPDARRGRARAPARRGLVRNETCAEVARRARPRRGAPARRRRGALRAAADRRRSSATCCEAVIGAIYLDGGSDRPRKLHRASLAAADDEPARSAPRRQDRRCRNGRRASGMDPPRYRVVERSGPDHAPTFIVTVNVDGLRAGRGRGRSKREAEQAAATAILVREGVWKARRERTVERADRAAASSRSSARRTPASRR